MGIIKRRTVREKIRKFVFDETFITIMGHVNSSSNFYCLREGYIKPSLGLCVIIINYLKLYKIIAVIIFSYANKNLFMYHTIRLYNINFISYNYCIVYF